MPDDICLYGWVSYLHRAATTGYLCCGQALEDSQGAGRTGLTHILVKNNSKPKDTSFVCDAKVYIFFHKANIRAINLHTK